MRLASRGSTCRECSDEAPTLPVAPQNGRYLSRLNPSTGAHDWPQSSLRKRPAGCVPANTTPGWLSCPGETLQMVADGTGRRVLPLAGRPTARSRARALHIRRKGEPLTAVVPRLAAVHAL